MNFSTTAKPLLYATDDPDSDARLLCLLLDNASAIALPGQALGCTHFFRTQH